MNDIEEGLKLLFQTGRIKSIYLGITLAFAQDYTFKELAEKCLDDWLLWTSISMDFSSKNSGKEFSSPDGAGRGSYWFAVWKYESTDKYTIVKYQYYNDQYGHIINRKEVYDNLEETKLDLMIEFLQILYYENGG